MKLYTEEDLKKVISIYSEEYKTTTDEILSELNLTPTELPTDEEILVASDEFELNSRVSLGMHISFEIGARWMRNKIKGDKK